jgi:hypothetical protein
MQQYGQKIAPNKKAVILNNDSDIFGMRCGVEGK